MQLSFASNMCVTMPRVVGATSATPCSYLEALSIAVRLSSWQIVLMCRLHSYGPVQVFRLIRDAGAAAFTLVIRRCMLEHSPQPQPQFSMNLTDYVMLLHSVLLMVRLAIAGVAGSLSIIVTTLDAVLDVISGFIIWSTSVAKRRRNKYKYPIGQARAHVQCCRCLPTA